VENSVIVRKKEAHMARPFPHASSKPNGDGRIEFPEFEPLLNSQQAAELLQIHHKTLQKLARRGDIRASQVGKLWRFRISDLNAWLDRDQRAS